MKYCEPTITFNHRSQSPLDSNEAILYVLYLFHTLVIVEYNTDMQILQLNINVYW